MRSLLSAVTATSVLAGCCGLGGFGGGSGQRGSWAEAEPEPVEIEGEAEAAPAEPPARGQEQGFHVALDVGADVHIDTTFAECTDPTGAALGVFAGAGLRHDGHGVIARAGATLGIVGEHEYGAHGRAGMWAGVGYSGVPRDQFAKRGALTAWSIMPLVTRTAYFEADEPIARAMSGAGDSPVRWGGGIALDVVARFRADRAAFHFGMRLVADSREIVGTMQFGVAFMR